MRVEYPGTIIEIRILSFKRLNQFASVQQQPVLKVDVALISWTVCGLASYVSASAVSMLAW